jgi:hypothetical protein
MSDLSPQSGPKWTLNRSLPPIVILEKQALKANRRFLIDASAQEMPLPRDGRRPMSSDMRLCSFDYREQSVRGAIGTVVDGSQAMPFACGLA